MTCEKRAQKFHTDDASLPIMREKLVVASPNVGCFLRLDFPETINSQSIKIAKSDLIDIDCIDQSIEIDDTLVSFIDLSRFYRFHRFISEDTSLLLFIQKWKLISYKQRICWRLSCNWESKDQTIYHPFFKIRFKFEIDKNRQQSSDFIDW